MITAVIVLSVTLIVVVTNSLAGAGKRSSMDAEIMELKSELYTTKQRNAKLVSEMKRMKSAWQNMKETIPLDISATKSQDKSRISSLS